MALPDTRPSMRDQAMAASSRKNAVLEFADGEWLLDRHDLADHGHLESSEGERARPPYRRWMAGGRESMTLSQAAMRGRPWALRAYGRWARAHRGRCDAGRSALAPPGSRRHARPRAARRDHRARRRASTARCAAARGDDGDPAPARPRPVGQTSVPFSVGTSTDGDDHVASRWHLAASARPEVLTDNSRVGAAGEAAGIVIDDFPPTQAFAMPHTSAKIIPCPWATRAASCAARRVSLGAEDLPKRESAAAFKALEPTKRLMSEKLVELGTRAQGGPPAGDKNLERSCNLHPPGGAS